jgi:GR25 family glycosyltransferase involved in LPS biosynthesis
LFASVSLSFNLEISLLQQIIMEYIDNAYVINMNRSAERLEQMMLQIPILGKQFVRIEAINGASLHPELVTPQLTSFCKYTYTNSMVGCFLSHKKAWETVVRNNDEYAIVMEDDCKLISTFQTDFKHVMDELISQKPDFIYLGYFGCNYDKSEINIINRFISFILPKIKWRGEGRYYYTPTSPFGFHCYVISKSCAAELLYLLSKISYHVDIQFLDHANSFKVFASKKKLATQYASALTSTQTVFAFPTLFNTVLESFRDNEENTYAFYLSNTWMQLGQCPINSYFILWCLFCLLFPNKNIMLVIATSFLGVEYCLNPENSNIILRWFVVGCILYGIRLLPSLLLHKKNEANNKLQLG